MVEVGDDICVEGVVKDVCNGCILIKTKTGNRFWIEPKDIKTHRPNNERAKTDTIIFYSQNY